MVRRFAAAIAKAELHPLEGDGATARSVVDTTGQLEIVGPEHALDGSTTLCGLPADTVVVMRHLWSILETTSCRACRDAFSGNQPGPCGP